MSELKATPGPWSYCACGCGFIGGGDNQVATVTIGKWGDEGIDITTGKLELVHHWGTVPNETADANAHLIAAAPSLYEALTIAVAVLDKAGIIWMGEPKASAALALARGESV